MKAAFVKMHGCGNDFVIIDGRHYPSLSARALTPLAHRQTGVGCDQIIVIEPASDATAHMRILNPDGSEAGACGNATRCVADILMREARVEAVVVRTVAGHLPARRLNHGLIQVDMGPPRFGWQDIPLAAPMDTLHLHLEGSPSAASMGNPHVTFFVDKVVETPIAELGPRFERHALFPQRANIGFAQVIDQSTIRVRVWERGAGLTLACGSGACAALVNARRRGLSLSKAQIVLDGGSLEIEWADNGHVLMAGPVASVFTGEVELQ